MLSNQNTVLVVLSVNNWLGYKYDKKASQETTEQHKMEKGAGRFNKKLVPKYALKPIKTVIQDFKIFFIENTLPFEGLIGTRILPASSFIDFSNTASEVNDQLSEKVDNFIKDYQTYKEQAQRMLGSLYNESDYPSVDKLPELFNINVRYLPVPESQNFNTVLGNTQIRELNDQLARSAELSVEELFFRAYTVLTKLWNVLDGETQRIFHSTTVGNIEKTISQLNKLNYLNRPEVTQLQNMMESDVTGVKIHLIKESKVYCRKTRERIQPILDFIAKYYEFTS